MPAPPQVQARLLSPQSLGRSGGVLAAPAAVVADLASHFQFHSSSASRVTAGAAGFLTFSH
jgi:hypothetical protein